MEETLKQELEQKNKLLRKNWKFIITIVTTYIPNALVFILSKLNLVVDKLFPSIPVLVIISLIFLIIYGYLYFSLTYKKLSKVIRIAEISLFIVIDMFLFTLVFIFAGQGKIAKEPNLFQVSNALLILMLFIYLPLKYLQSLNQFSCPLKPLNTGYAVTGTCIPFEISNDKVYTYLILNETYTIDNWMFPGGHAIDNSGILPEMVAIDKARSEAGLGVEIIQPNKQDKVENGSRRVKSLIQPHISYLISMNESALCYKENGHKYHLDCIYICNVIETYLNHSGYITIKVELPNKLRTLTETKKVINKAIFAYMEENGESLKMAEVGDYAVEMLLTAYNQWRNFNLINKTN